MDLQVVPFTSSQAAVTHTGAGTAGSRVARSGLVQSGRKWTVAPAESTEEEEMWE